MLSLCLPSSGSLVGFITHSSFPGQVNSAANHQAYCVYCKCLCLLIKEQVNFLNDTTWKSFYLCDSTMPNV